MAFTRDLDNLIPIMTSNTAPSGYVASASSEYASAHAAWKAMDGDVSSHWATAANTPAGWLRIDFPVSLIVNKYKITAWSDPSHNPKSWTFEGSNNGTDWTVLDTRTNVSGLSVSSSVSFVFSNTTSYTKYRINISANNGTNVHTVISELELCATGQYASLIPPMTSNTAPSGVASASSIFSSTYDAYKAFTGTQTNETDSWVSSEGSVVGWLQYQFPIAKVVKQYSILNRQGVLERCPKTWTFNGSNDGSNWTTLDTQTNITSWAEQAAKTFSISNTTAYKYYRIDISAQTTGDRFVSLGELRMFGYGSPVHRWQLTENANDSVGTLNLTNNGSVTFSSDGASFNGSSQWLSGTKTISGGFSWSLWVKPPASLPAGTYSPMGIWNGSGTGIGFEILNSPTLQFIVNGTGNGVSISNEWVSTKYPSSEHTLMVMTCTGPSTGTVQAYRNNIQLGSASISVAYSTASIFAIGKFGGYSGEYFTGYVKDARIYDYALSASEISALAAAGPNPSAASPTLYRPKLIPVGYFSNALSGGSY